MKYFCWNIWRSIIRFESVEGWYTLHIKLHFQLKRIPSMFRKGHRSERLRVTSLMTVVGFIFCARYQGLGNCGEQSGTRDAQTSPSTSTWKDQDWDRQTELCESNLVVNPTENVAEMPLQPGSQWENSQSFSRCPLLILIIHGCNALAVWHPAYAAGQLAPGHLPRGVSSWKMCQIADWSCPHFGLLPGPSKHPWVRTMNKHQSKRCWV